MANVRKSYLDCARGLAILSIVFIHIIIRMEPNFAQSLELFSTIIKNAAFLPLLFIISGALSFRTINDPTLNPLACLEKFAKQYLIPFYALNVLFFFQHLAGGLFSDNFKSATSMLRALLTFSIGENMPSGVLWFLFTLFLFLATTLVWVRLAKLNTLWLFVLGVVLWFLSPFFENTFFLSLDRYTANLCYFAFGFYFSEKILDLKMTGRECLLLLALFAASLIASLYWPSASPYVLLPASLAGPCLVIMAFRYLEKWNKNKGFKTMEFLGINSIFIYVFHMPSFKFILPLINRFDLQASYLGLAIWFVAGIVLPLLVGMVFVKLPALHRAVFQKEPNFGLRKLIGSV